MVYEELRGLAAARMANEAAGYVSSSGTFDILVGASSERIRETARIKVTRS